MTMTRRASRSPPQAPRSDSSVDIGSPSASSEGSWSPPALLHRTGRWKSPQSKSAPLLPLTSRDRSVSAPLPSRAACKPPSPSKEDAVAALMGRSPRASPPPPPPPRSSPVRRDSKTDKSMRDSSSSRSLWGFSFRTIVLFFLSLAAIGFRHHYLSLRQSLASALDERDDLQESNDRNLKALQEANEAKRGKDRSLERTQKAFAGAEREAMMLREKSQQAERALKAERAKSSALEKRGANDETIKALEISRLTAVKLREAIQRQSRREVIDKFGPGPHRVEMKLEFRDPNGPNGKAMKRVHYLTIETAPLDLMPHAVSTFLNQVKAGLWNGTEIFRSLRHILMTRLPNESKQLKKFKEAGLEELAFQEHNDAFPHNKYTLGFAGKPGGPLFYINRVDNADSHGANPAKGKDGEPCFGKIVEKTDVVEWMAGLPKGKDGVLVDPVLIKEAYVMRKMGAKGKWGRV